MNLVRYKPAQSLPVVLCLLLSCIIGYLIGNNVVDTERIFQLAFGLLIIIVLLIVRRTVFTILLLASLAVVLGWRGFFISQGVSLFPGEVLIWVGGAVVTLRWTLYSNVRHRKISLLVAGLLVITLISLLTTFSSSRSMPLVLLDLRSFALVFPILLVTKEVIHNDAQILKVIKYMLIATSIIALLGILEFFVPSVSDLVPSFFRQSLYTRFAFESSVINISSFNFWGTTAVAVVFAPGVIFALALSMRSGEPLRPLWLLVTLILLLGVLVSGYRSAFFGVLIGLCSFVFLSRRRIHRFVLPALAGLLVLALVVPEGLVIRFLNALQLRDSGDTSIIQRVDVLQSAVQLLLHNPFGVGWGSGSLLGIAVHNDWMFIALSLGLPGLTLFILWFLITLKRSWDVPSGMGLETPTGTLKVALISALLSYAACMVSGAISQVIPLSVVFWLTFCLAVRFAELHDQHALSVSTTIDSRLQP